MANQSKEWISHRGIQKDAAENTFLSFSEARRRGFKRLETDLRVSADNHIVLSHDENLWRIAKKNIVVSSTSRKELEKVELFNGSKLMFFDQLVDQFSDLKWIFDIKPEGSRHTISMLLNWAQNSKGEDWLIKNVRFAFWRKSDEEFLLSVLPKATLYANKDECIKTGLSLLVGLPLGWVMKKGRTYSFPRQWHGLSYFKRSYVEKLHAKGSKALAFLPKTPEEIGMAIEAGFDELLVDDNFHYKVE